MKTSSILGGAMSLALAAVSGAALADYPEKPVTFIVPFPPGDLEDVLTRMIADDFQAEYGVAAAVVNKPGGGGGPYFIQKISNMFLYKAGWLLGYYQSDVKTEYLTIKQAFNAEIAGFGDIMEKIRGK